MLFQGKEFPENEVREAYEDAKDKFEAFGVPMLDFNDWVQYNNDYVIDKEKALDKWLNKASNKGRKVKNEKRNRRR